MITTFLSLLLAAQVANGENCCSSKKVGDKTYKLVDTDPANPPSICVDSCAYEDVAEKGSLYCFKEGNLPSTCKGEMATEIQCDPACVEYDRKIVDAAPTTVTEKPTYQDCWQYCRWLCNRPWCFCNAWTFMESNATCYTYAENGCYTTEFAEDFITGSLCYDTNKTTGSTADFSGQNITKLQPICLGDLRGATNSFTDYDITEKEYLTPTRVTIHAGSFGEFDPVVVGIQATYQTPDGNFVDGPHHGLTGTGTPFVYTSDPNKGTFLFGLEAWSINTFGSKSFIYGLGLYKTDETIVIAGEETTSSERTVFNENGNQPIELAFISGRTLPLNGMLGNLCLWFKSQ